MSEFETIALMSALAVATYLCRVTGYLAMQRVPFTPGVRRALEALPGCVMAAVIVPGVLGSGFAGLFGVVTAMIVMALVKKDIAAMVAGCAVAALVRAAGF